MSASRTQTESKSRSYYRARTFCRRVRAFLGRGWLSERTRVVVQCDTDRCTAPIFVVGTHRSGTSLLRRILDSHRNIACPPESFWLMHYTALLNDTLAFDGLWDLGFSRNEALKGLKHGASYFHEAYCRAKGKTRWADKTPQYVQHLDTLYALFGPDVRFVLIVRHPMDVAFSIWNREWSFVPPSGDQVTDSCQYVLDSGFTQLEFRERHVQACHLLYYDQLVHQPKTVVHRLCTEFLHEPWDPNMLLHDEMPHDFGCEDPIVRGTRGFRGSYENWKEWSVSEIDRAASILHPLMKKLGYSLDSPYHHQSGPLPEMQA